MGLGGISHWIILLVIVLLLFGATRISSVMGEFGKGIKSFKKGLADEDEDRSRNLPPQGKAPERPIEVTPEPRPRETPSSDEQPRG